MISIMKRMSVNYVQKDNEHIKINKRDFEKLKKSAIKAYEQHNLYATVSKRIETSEKLKDEYKQERDNYYNKYNSIIRI